MTSSPLRADAARNRRRLLDAAVRVFTEKGLDAGVDEIAREACVGVGTLYRRFPTKEDLVGAVLEDRVQGIVAALEAAAAEADPWTALERALQAIGEAVVFQHAALHDIKRSGVHGPLVCAARERVLALLGEIIARGQAAGVVRADLAAVDAVALSGMLARLPAWQLEQDPGIWRRYLGLMLDGLRPEAAHPLPHAPTRAEPPFMR